MSKPRLTAESLVTWGIALAGSLAIVLAGRHAVLPRGGVLMLVALLTAAAEYTRIPLPRGGYQTFGPAVAVPAVAFLGPVAGAWTSAFGVLIGNGLLHERRRGEILFGFGQRILTALAAGLAWTTILLGHPALARVPLGAAAPEAAAAVLALVLVYAAGAAIQVAAFLAGTGQESFWAALVWGGMWRLPISVTLAAFGLSAAIAFAGAHVGSAREFANVLIALLTVGLVALLYLSRRQQLRDLAHLHGGLSQMLHSLDLPAVLNALADQVGQLAKPDILWIALRGDDGADEIALARARDVDLGLLRASPCPEDGLMAWALAHREPARVHDYQRDPRRSADSDRIFGRNRLRAALVVPLVAADELVGAIALTHPVPGYFTEYHEQVIRTLTAQAAVALRNAALYQTARRHLARFAALKAISERINSQQDLEAVFDLIAQSARDLLSADRCGLYLGRPGSDVTHMMAKGLPPEYLERVARAIRAGEGLSSRALALRRPVVVTDMQAEDDAGWREWAERLGLRSAALFPLAYRGGMIGALALYHDAVHPYGPSELEVGIALASQAAIAVQNTRLRREAEEKAHQLGLLNRAFTRVATSSRPGELFETLVEELHTTLGYPMAIIRILENGQLRHVAHRGYAGIKERTPLSAGIVGRVARTGRPAFVADVSRDPDYIARDPRVTQEACVPITSGGRVAGVINVEVIEPRLTQADFELLTTLAGYAAVALEKVQLYEETRALATTDGLTGLLNYRAFWQALDRELERSMRYGLPLSLVMIEIDKFKRYNDAFGHLRGDEVLRLVARVLMQEHRAQVDVVARYGGDEFVILLPHTQKITAGEVAERIRAAVESTPLISDTHIASVTLSLGVASYPEDGKSPDALVEAADRSMYRAKERGGNAVALAPSP